jgi:glucose/arabinose dehydrogenase
MRLIRSALPILISPAVFAATPKVEELYKTNCAGCHGAQMQGGSGSSLIDGVWKHGASDEDIARVIRMGVPTMGMPTMEKAISPDQARALVVFIRERETRAAKEKTPAPKADADKIFHTQYADFRMEVVAEKLNNPWAVAPLSDGRILLTEKAGRLFVIGADGKISAPVKGVPETIEHGQGGLMDVAVHPNFKDNGWIYLVLSEGSREGGRTKCVTALIRGRIKDGAWTDNQWLWKAAPEFHTDGGVHFGSRIVFDGKGHVFFIVGERGRNFNQGAQDVATPYGKIFRLMDDGAIPADNPFAKNTAAIPGLWSYGHRNPQGMALDPRNGDLYATEHGPRGGDEFNLIRPGLNYGWPVVSFGINYDGRPWNDGTTARPEMEPPVIFWTPSIAVCGTAFVSGEKFRGWRNDCLVGALAGQEVRRLRVIDRKVTEQETLFRNLGRVRDVKCGPDGSVYVLFNGPDRLVILTPANSAK